MAIAYIKDDETSGPGIYTPTSGITRVVANNAGPFTYTGTGTYILHDDATCAVIDPGPDEDSHLERILQAVGSRKVSAILITHTHKDHSPCAQRLKERTNGQILGCARAPETKSNQTIHLDESQDLSYQPDRVLVDGETLTFSFGDIRAVSTPGHLSNHLCYHWLVENALFSGDHIMGWSTTVVIPPDGDMAEYMASLRKTLALQPSTVWPTHGQPIENPGSFIEALIAHRIERERTILEQIQSGNGEIMGIVEALYQATPRQLYPAAALSVFAHVSDLCARSLVHTDHQIELEAFFKPAKAQA